MKKMHLSIPKPCHEDWANMTPQARGRFCQSCQKTVVDFTNMSDREVLHFLENQSGNTCGRFRKTQLNKEYQFASPQPNTQWIKAGLLASSLLTAAGVTAQTTPIQTPTEIHVNPTTDSSKPTIPPTQKVIHGTIMDDSGEGLIGASILIANTEIGTATDFDGNYELAIPAELATQPTLEIIVSYIGYESKFFTIELKDLKTAHNAVLEFHASLVGEIVGLIAYYPERTVGGYVKKFFREVENKWSTKRQKRKKQRQQTATERKESNQQLAEIPAIKPTAVQPQITRSLVYPNPFVDNFQLNYTSPTAQTVQLTLVDVGGKIVFSRLQVVEKGENVISLTPDLINGNYWLRIESVGAETEVLAISRLVKE